MSLTPSRDVFITCAVTGSGDSTGRSDKVPVSPRAIADSCIEAAEEGAAIVHIHVRDPETGKPSRDPALYEKVAEHIAASGKDMVINFTAGMGGDLTLGPSDAPLPPNDAATDMISAEKRLEHVANVRPEICTLDCGTMNFGEGDYIMTNTPAMLKDMAGRIQKLGVRPEVEVFDTGHLVLAKWLHAQGLLDDPVMVQLCMGIPWGAPNDLPTLMSLVANMPDDWIFSAFSIGRDQLPYVAAAVLAGGNIRVGLEDNIWLKKGVLASNGDLTREAVKTAEGMACNILGPNEVRAKLKLEKRW
ncbi:BKACE family enzyme [Pararhizobium mangrovi]|uniref:3-keto-5-aminohexanoate cleavage protein n=1 Tax=Pararhizobium mangrovi TaxID=2590452 RepID=A0A506U0R3_9HYPH|nr:3-keto-5-aminohexanoate cleavage protein [Pararhizobium mangrovi]TPW27943.1 3-keto-5-aminohexanoate cleavage protein [Pararhizobium mangrovi]